MPGIIDAVLAVLVTPETLIRIHSDGTNLKDVIDGLVSVEAAREIYGVVLGKSLLVDLEETRKLRSLLWQQRLSDVK